MIEVQARLGDGFTAITVTGHGRETPQDGIDGARVCAAISAITQTALLGIQAVAEAHPDLVSVNIKET